MALKYQFLSFSSPVGPYASADYILPAGNSKGFSLLHNPLGLLGGKFGLGLFGFVLGEPAGRVFFVIAC
jgi:hypothetical protein